MLKSLPPWGKVLNKVKRMRGKCAAATRERVVLGGLALISQRAGPLTASPEGEAFLTHKKADAAFVQRLLCGYLFPGRQRKHKPAPFALLALGVDLPA